MGSTNSLKSRFEKLQKASESITDVVMLDTPVVSDPKMIELLASSHPEVHEAVREAPKLQYDWKKQYKMLVHRPSLEYRRSKAMIEFEWNMQLLIKNPPIISFSQNSQLDPALLKASAHIAGSKDFWIALLKNAHNLHVSSVKNRIHLTVNYYSSTKDLKAEIKKNLENEYLSENNTIKTFHLTGHDNWIDIILELTPATNGPRAEDAAI